MVNNSMNPGPRKYFQKTKTHRETCPNESAEIFKILLFCIKHQNGGVFEVKCIPLLITFLLN